MHRRFDNDIRKYDADIDTQYRTLNELMSEIGKRSEVLAEFTGRVAKTTADHQKFSHEMTRQRVQHKSNLLSYAMYEGENREAQEDILKLQRTISELRDRSAVASEQEMKERNAVMKEELEKELVFNQNLNNDLKEAERRCKSALPSRDEFVERPKTRRKDSEEKTESWRQRRAAVKTSSQLEQGRVTGRPPLPPLAIKKIGRNTAATRKQAARRDVKPPHQYDVTAAIGASSSVHDELVLPPIIHKKKPPTETRNVSPVLALPPMSGRSSKGSQGPSSSMKMTLEVTHTVSAPLPDIKRREQNQSPGTTNRRPCSSRSSRNRSPVLDQSATPADRHIVTGPDNLPSRFVTPVAIRENKAPSLVTSPPMDMEVIHWTFSDHFV